MTAEQCRRALVALGAVLLLVVGCTGPASPDQQSVSAVPTTSPAAAAPTSAAASGALTSPTASPVAEAEEDAATALAILPMKDPAWGPKYDRKALFLPNGELGEFDSDGNGCDQRNDLLARQLTGVRMADDGCVVRSGTLADPYSGHTLEFRRGAESNAIDFDIDHVVALGNAWRTGAQQWKPEQRLVFATDVRDQQVTEKDTNLEKLAKDASEWLPANAAYRCTYVARQIAVKAAYGLWVTQPEHDKMVEVLDTCPGQQLPGTS